VKYQAKDVEINYINYGNKKGQNIVLLHGWGQNIEMMKPIGDNLQSKYNIYIVDLPGHGSSTEPTSAWQLSDFATCLKEMFDHLKIKKPILVGHSVGGEIALVYASMFECEKIVLMDSPFRPIKKLSLKTKVLKSLKKVPGLNKLENFAKKHMGSTEYRSASIIMRQILVNSVNTDLTETVKNIKASCIIIWGTIDDTVPLESGYDLEKLMKDAALIEYENCTHYAYLEDLGRTVGIIDSFIGG